MYQGRYRRNGFVTVTHGLRMLLPANKAQSRQKISLGISNCESIEHKPKEDITCQLVLSRDWHSKYMDSKWKSKTRTEIELLILTPYL